MCALRSPSVPIPSRQRPQQGFIPLGTTHNTTTHYGAAEISASEENPQSPHETDPFSLIFEHGNERDHHECDEFVENHGNESREIDGDDCEGDDASPNAATLDGTDDVSGGSTNDELDVDRVQLPTERQIMSSFGSFTLTMSSERISRKSQPSSLSVITEGLAIDDATCKSEQEIQEEILCLTKSPSRKVDIDDFELLKLIGVGGFGKVFQIREKKSGSIYAMKVYKKAAVVKHDQGKYAHTERDILKEVSDHPFIVTLHYSFQTNHKLYFVMDFLNGGQLFFHLRNEHMFPESQVRFYLAEITLALEHLHKLDIIHRDLKPENLLLDCDGHVVVTDFGLAKASVNRKDATNSFCGTEEYMAPEMIDRLLYGKAVDWWALGALMFDMLTGNPPFVSSNRLTLYKKIKTEKIKYPKYLTGDAVSLIKGLLNRDVEKRLGSGPRGTDEVKSHPFFKTVNWKKLYNREITPVFKPPVVAGELDVSNFDTTYTKQVPHDSPSSFQLSGSHGNIFKGFSYVAPHMLGTPTSGPSSPLNAPN